MPLRAIVIGSGWAAEGHTWALQAAGVEVVALCGRNPETTMALAARLGIKAVGFDWYKTLTEFRPDIVSIATPAASHREMAVAAAEAGCHVVCEKPLAVAAAEAREIFEAAQRAGVKTAYAATGCYGASYIHTRDLIGKGLIGEVREIEYRTLFSRTLLYSWMHQLKLGGGLLNNLFTHHLQQVLFVTGGRIVSAMGTTSNYQKRAPVLAGSPPTDWRQTIVTKLTPEQVATAEWRTIDVEFGYKVLAQLQMQNEQIASALFTCTEGANEIHPTTLAFHGTRGTLGLITKPGGHGGDVIIQHFDAQVGSWHEIMIPQTVINSLPQVEDRVQRQWHQFFKEFVADVSGEGYSGYPTFRHGWEAAEIIEIVRCGQNWSAVKVPNR
jgi:predicted dehydrogenase